MKFLELPKKNLLPISDNELFLSVTVAIPGQSPLLLFRQAHNGLVEGEGAVEGTVRYGGQDPFPNGTKKT